MEARHALLIGIPCCDNDAAFPPIPDDVIRSDITRMARALSQSAYKITVLGMAPAEDVPNMRYVTELASRSRCLDEIANACNEVPEGGTLLIYFSGHGVRIGGADFLIPRDFSRLGPDGKLQTSRLVPVDFTEEAALCQARVMLCFIDACRIPPATDSAESGQSATQLPKGSFALVRGCAPDAVCEWQEGSGSVFTRALAHALQRNQSPRTLGQVLQATRDRLRDQDSPQRPHTVFAGPVTESEVLGTVICEGIRLLDDWRTAVLKARLWTLADDSEHIEALLNTVRDLVSGYGKQVGQMRDHLAKAESLTDAWTDDGYPGRVLDALYQLLTPPDSQPAVLHPAEAAALVAAPFLREAVLALGLHDVPEVRVRDFTRHFGTGYRSDLENVFASHEQLTRRASGLADTRPADRDALVMWLVYRWILEREDLWEESTTQALTTNLARAILTTAGLPASEARSRELGHVLLSMTRCLTTVLGPESGASDARSETVRRRPLGYLLSIAGVLGADPRRMSGVLADHIGTYDTVELSQLHEALAADITWRRDGNELVVDAVCGHPAVHVALADLAEEADYACATARKAGLDMPEHDGGLLVGLPARCGEDLRPEGSAYGKPLMRFHLAGDRIRDLLMGTQLYGDDASVAIREVYQNALDACRYRHMRLRCSQRTEDPEGWNGKIVLRQGVEPDGGRHYIECEDNGVGMTEAVLRHVFTAAGTRFVHTEVFRREEARWRQFNPAYRLYPNSQFGIGVFSYFMLADEVSVWTAATDESGLGVESQLYIHIPGPGGLFRLRRNEPMPEGILGGGTRVRLYLPTPLREPAEMILADYLVVSDYKVEVRRDGTLIREWRPGVPEYPKRAGSSPHVGAERVWWVDGPGILLSDGLIIGQRDVVSSSDSQFTSRVRVNNKAGSFGRLIDLTGPHQPRLSIDRTSMLDWDRDWTTQQAHKSVPTLTDWPGFTWNWLWSLMRDDLLLAQAVFDQHSSREIPVNPERNSPRAKIDDIGCYAEDSEFFKRAVPKESEWDFIVPWRAAVWRQAIGRMDMTLTNLPEPENISGFPVLTPMDLQALKVVTEIARILEPDEEPDKLPSGKIPFTYSDLLYHLRRFVLAGLNLQSLQDVEDYGDPKVVILVTALSNIYGETPVPVQLLMAAIYLNRPIGEIAEQFCTYADSCGFPLPEQVGPDLLPTTRDLQIVSVDFDGVAPWHTRLTEGILTDASDEIGKPLEWIRDRIAAYTRIGFSALPVHQLGPPPEDDLIATTIYNIVCDLDGPPRPSALTEAAFKLHLSERDVYDLIAEEARDHGITVPESSDHYLPTDVPTEADFNLHQRLRGTLGPLTWIARDRRSFLAETPSAQAAELYHRNAHMLRIPNQIKATDLVVLAKDLGTSLSYAVSVVQDLFADRIDAVSLQTIMSTSASLRPSRSDVTALIKIIDGQASWHSPSATAVAKLGADAICTAGEVIERLSAYVPLGAQVPTIDADLANYWPDIHDYHALAIPTPGETITAIQLMRIAGRYGWTVQHAFDRLYRFRAFGIHLGPVRDLCPDAIVHWPDVIVLSQNFDGADPGLCGTVSLDRIAGAAEIVREAVTETRARLLRYADLFQLEVQELT